MIRKIADKFKFLKPAYIDIVVYDVSESLSIIVAEFIAVLHTQTNDGYWTTVNLGRFTAFITGDKVEIRAK